MNVAQLLVKGMELELPEKLKRYVFRELDTVCAITGEPITEGIPWKRVIPSSTGEYLDLMHGMAFEYLSLEAAAAYKGSWNMGSRLIFEDGTMYHPYIAASSAAKNDRTYWSALVRDVWPEREGQECVVIVAGDFKKKVWPGATTGPLGPNTPVYVLDPDRFVSRNLTVDWARMLKVLDLVEEVYTVGFTKQGIEQGLYQDYGALTEDLGASLEYERRLEEVRATPEFTVSILIAQKGEI